ncbi:phosphoribosylanthranilate isomerase [Moraxella haemolytica]|uniref:phosphoribosylanthranilate isomerase n=1 Tax=Moraxella haemolytica TaxID=2904119 RepID=UPI002542974C|nr:phosphoribosylanthranilate isomerase [Moraxella sp. ZY171148]WII94772.1 phosphoribosylanthranilate isomerase [Moraxella sp. ZY171148]
MQIKFCGLTQSCSLKTAVSLDVNAIGLVFYPPSPRYVDIATAQVLAQVVPAFTTLVALVVNMGESELVNLAKSVPFDIVQFHGDETASECQQLASLINKRWIKAIRVGSHDTQDAILGQIQELTQCGASGVILDTFSQSAFGGTGQAFDWQKIPDDSPLPIYLAGGLTPDNIGDVINNKSLMAKIAGVDVSGGIEKEKGVKCGEKMIAFMKGVKSGYK